MIKDSPFVDKKPFLENESAFAIEDGYPISPGHSLIVPKLKVRSIFALSEVDYLNCFKLVAEVKKYLEVKCRCQNFNIGINNGELAGQTVQHAHIHVIPRYKGDVPNPRGGIRHVIPGKGNY